MKRAKTAALILCIVVAVLMVATVALQFVPYWTVDDQTASIADYVWMPKDYKDFTKHFQNFYATVLYSDFAINDFVSIPLVIFVCFSVGTILCCFKLREWFSFILPFIGGIYGACGYAYNFILQMGNLWILHMLLCIVIAIISGIGLICSFLGNVKVD